MFSYFISLFKLCFGLFFVGSVTTGFAQKKEVQNRPYLDFRKFHYGFFVGSYIQSFNLINNGRIENGRQWFVENDRFDPGFQVGVLGEWKLHDNFSFRLLPTIYFGNNHLTFKEQATKEEKTQNLRTTLIALPLEIKMNGKRINNYRPYFLTGLMPVYNLTRQNQDFIASKPFNLYIELGAGCDFYFPFFKFIPELKFSFGLLNLLKTERQTLLDKQKLIFTQSVDRANSNMVSLTFYFE